MNYKLKKELPFAYGPKPGYISKPDTLGTHFWLDIYLNPHLHPEYWEEVRERDFEILTFKGRDNGEISRKIFNGRFLWEGRSEADLPLPIRHSDGMGATESYMFENNHEIHSVGRIKDNQVFCVGDKICGTQSDAEYKGGPGYVTITGFSLSGDKIRTHHTTGVNIGFDYNRYREPVFTAEDGVGICPGDSYYFISIGSKRGIVNRVSYADPTSGKEKDFRYFSSHAKALEALVQAQPLLSIDDVINVIEDYHLCQGNIGMIKSELQELAKNKVCTGKTQ